MVHFGDPDLDRMVEVLRRLGHDLRFTNPLKLRLQLARFHICATAIQVLLGRGSELRGQRNRSSLTKITFRSLVSLHPRVSQS